MSIRTTPFVEKEFYHIYNRGNSKQIIFKDAQDYSRFVGLLYACNSIKKLHVADIGIRKNFFDLDREECLVAIGAYVLMPNHFHILLTPLVEGGVSLFMQKVSTAYSMYFNKKYERTGGLFEGKFKSRHAGDDRYLKYLFSYIHLNPVKMIDPTWKEFGLRDKKVALEYLNKYEYSSYIDFAGVDRKEKKILETSLFPDYFPSVRTFETEILGWFSTRQDLVE
jgi:putative transposase